jgi:D-amino-acid dehydrogenase
MPAATADIAVIGAGIVGAACAYELATRGVSVALFDSDVTGRASDAGAGIMSPHTFLGETPAMTALALASGAHYDKLIERLGADGAWGGAVSTTGMLRIAIDEGELEYFAEGLKELRLRAPGLVEEID